MKFYDKPEILEKVERMFMRGVSIEKIAKSIGYSYDSVIRVTTVIMERRRERKAAQRVPGRIFAQRELLGKDQPYHYDEMEYGAPCPTYDFTDLSWEEKLIYWK